MLVIGFGVAFFVIYLAYSIYPEYLARQVTESAQKNINNELANFEAAGDKMALDPKLLEAVSTGDIPALNTVVGDFKKYYNTPLITITNADGTAISRARSKNILGDNVYFNSPYGRAIARGETKVLSIEVSGINPREIVLVTGRPLYKNGRAIGALFTGRSFDDNFAQSFAAEHLRHNVHIAFYTNDHGVSSSSIIGEQDRKLFDSYFYPNSSLAAEHDNTFIRVPGRGIFFFRNITFPGLESSPGGMILLIPLKGFWLTIGAGILIPCLIFILWILFKQYPFWQRRTRRQYMLLATGCAAMYLVVAIGLHAAIFFKIVTLQQYIYPLYNSVLRFQPEGGIFDRNYSQRLSVVLDTGSENINAVSLHIAYNPLELSVQSVDMERSICQNFILSEHNSNTGEVIMECIIPNPGFKGNNAVVADLYVKPLTGVQSTTISFLDETRVLANDGLGTDVLRMATDARLQFIDSQTMPSNALLVFSASHPNSERWYSNRKVNVAWAPAIVGSVVSEAEGSFGLSGLPPLVKTIGSDGVHTLRVIGRSPAGEELHGSTVVRIDTVPPDQVTLDVSEKRVRAGSLVRFKMSGHDALSGIQRIFYLKINDEIFFPVGSEVYVPFPKRGLYAVTLRVYDKAGNYKDTTERIVVTK